MECPLQGVFLFTKFWLSILIINENLKIGKRYSLAINPAVVGSAR
nr:MAG TPA: hypothetical protein [Caudoviricetes sp.]DAT41546.1 MAG TPA: hypothetical protein [Caudoviricetes sp.]